LGLDFSLPLCYLKDVKINLKAKSEVIMKQKKSVKKLGLKKRTIADLDKKNMKDVRGGRTLTGVSCKTGVKCCL
jgi:natural product precursor